MKHLSDARRTFQEARNPGRDDKARAGPLGERARLTMANATTEARAGNYQGALTLLASLPEEAVRRPEVLDLRARIHAQQGRYREAEAAWLEALQLDLGNAAYLRGIDAIRKDRRFPEWVRLVKVALVLAALVLCFAWFVGREQPEGEGSAQHVEVLREEVAETLAGMKRGLDAVLQRLDRIEASLSVHEASPKPPRAPERAGEDAPKAKG